jgi:hypothetical protein
VQQNHRSIPIVHSVRSIWIVWPRAVLEDFHGGVTRNQKIYELIWEKIGAGYDQIDVHACTARDIQVSNVPTAVDDSTADTNMFLILGVLRGFNTCTFTSLPASLSQSTNKLHSNDGTSQRSLERSSSTTSRPRSTRQNPRNPRHGWHWTKPVCISGAQNLLFEPVSG